MAKAHFRITSDYYIIGFKHGRDPMLYLRAFDGRTMNPLKTGTIEDAARFNHIQAEGIALTGIHEPCSILHVNVQITVKEVGEVNQ